MKVNPEMVILAREYRGLTQSALAQASGLSQPRIARVEAGTGAELSDDELKEIGKVLAFPIGFFFLQEQRFSYGTSAVFTRSRQLTATEKKKLSGLVNVLRIQIKRMLGHVDVQGSRRLPRLDIGEYGSATSVARALRAAWNMPRGPVRELTKLIEGAGVLIVECDFDAVPMDATSVMLAEMPPIIFIDKKVPGDRWRFTLAHELAHLVMHDIPRPAMEDEADEFASEFLVPSDEIAPEFTRLKASRLDSYVHLKEYWGVSIAALIMKAETLRKIDANQKKWLYIQMSKLGIRMVEPAPIAREPTSLFPMLLDYFRNEMKFTDEEFGAAIAYLPERLKELYSAPSSRRPALRVVR